MDVIERRGWSNRGGSDVFRCYSPRQGRQWTDKEDYDLIEQIQYGVPLEWIADYHQRSLGGISSRLRLPERAQAGHDRYLSGAPKLKSSKSIPNLGKYLKDRYCGTKRYRQMKLQENQHGS